MSEIWPTQIKVAKDRQRLTVAFNNSAAYELSAEMLRVLSPSAEIEGRKVDQVLANLIDQVAAPR